MRKLTTVLALFLCLLPATAKKESKTSFNGLTAMSFNIRTANAKDGTNSWEMRADAVLEMIKDQHPDVIGMQEALLRQVQPLAYFLDGYKWIGVGREDGKKDGEIMAIFYNKKTTSLLKWGTYWLSETPEKPSKGWDAEYMRTATWALFKDKKSGKKYFMVNTHLDNSGPEARKNGLSLILDRIAAMNPGGLPLLLTGDFNMTLGDASMEPVKAAMHNCRDIAAKSDGLDTFHDWGRSRSSIDFIWEKGFGSCIEYQTLTKEYGGRAFVSDHFPILAKLIF
ncbi:MAG: endonuclease/exonuclease/phosphatase family protein [Bacteroidales bacterium]|nr:endonuclease/exonuclease/phosphatase family protein [Bacteroidales bacterium]